MKLAGMGMAYSPHLSKPHANVQLRNGQFEQTTGDPENVFIKDGMLHLKPTLQDEKLVVTNSVINLTASGLCTSDLWKNCVATTNITNGTIVPPVKIGRAHV